jgi:hypothetical protein
MSYICSDYILQMKNILIPVFAGLLLCNACNNAASNNSTQQKNMTYKDSADAITSKYAAAFNSLSNNKELYSIICQGWELEEDIETLSTANEPEGGYPFRSMYLSADSTYIRNPRTYFEYGNWQYNQANKTIVLKAKNGATTVFKIAALGLNEMILVQNGETAKMKFVAAGKQHISNATNPWHISNNKWRIKPSAVESAADIRNRVRGFMNFHILFYRDNIGKNEKVISFYGIPTCLKWYAGGIFVLKPENLPNNWYSCFYNKAQALQGRQLVDDIIGKKYVWNKARINWVMKNEEVLTQMYANL